MSETKAIEYISETLTTLLQKLHFPFSKVEAELETANIIRANIETEKVPFLIGTHGERIDALQHILKNISWNNEEIKQYFVIIDVDNYKKSREDKFIGIAEEKVEAVRETGISQTMPPTDAYIRRMVHLHLTQPQFDDITTESTGEGDRRRLQILKADSAAE